MLPQLPERAGAGNSAPCPMAGKDLEVKPGGATCAPSPAPDTSDSAYGSNLPLPAKIQLPELPSGRGRSECLQLTSRTLETPNAAPGPTSQDSIPAAGTFFPNTQQPSSPITPRACVPTTAHTLCLLGHLICLMLPLKTGLTQPEHGDSVYLPILAFFSIHVFAAVMIYCSEPGLPSKPPALSLLPHKE